MYESIVRVTTKVKIDKKAIKNLKKGKKVFISGWGLCSGDSIDTKVKPLKKGGFLIKPDMSTVEGDNPEFEVTTIEEVVEIIEAIYGSGKYYA